MPTHGGSFKGFFMPVFTIDVLVKYSGTESITIEIEAEDKEDAIYDAWNYCYVELTYHNIDIETTGIDILCEEDSPYRCDETKDMFKEDKKCENLTK